MLAAGFDVVCFVFLLVTLYLFYSYICSYLNVVFFIEKVLKFQSTDKICIKFER